AALDVHEQRDGVAGRDDVVQILERPTTNQATALLVHRHVRQSPLAQVRLECRLVMIVPLCHRDASNTKSEVRNPKQIQSPKSGMIKIRLGDPRPVSVIRLFEFGVCFVFRASYLVLTPSMVPNPP